MPEIPPKAYHRHIHHDANDRSVLPQSEKDVGFFEKQIVCIHHLLISKGYLPSLDSIRRAAEEIDGLFDRQQFSADIPNFLKGRLPEYGERRVLAVEEVFCEMGFITRAELQQTPDEISEETESSNDLTTNHYSPHIDEDTYPTPQYNLEALVQVMPHTKPGHIRVPAYLLGKIGKIVSFQGMFLNPEDVAHLKSTVVRLPLYLVEFEMAEVWGDSPSGKLRQRSAQTSLQDKVRAEIYEPWLLPA
ncbi:MAG: SH3-like domain-containing protein [Cyanobacteria bacterium J06634_5]